MPVTSASKNLHKSVQVWALPQFFYMESMDIEYFVVFGACVISRSPVLQGFTERSALNLRPKVQSLHQMAAGYKVFATRPRIGS